MSSLRQIEANRLNSQKSTGPRSAEGKAASRMNALKSGIDAESNIIRGENAAHLQALADAYYTECQPAGAQQQFYVDILIRNDWQLRRLESVDAEMWAYQLQGYSRELPGCELGRSYAGMSSAFARLQRRKNDILRANVLARQELQKLKAEVPTAAPSQPVESTPAPPEIGFVPEAANQPPSPPFVGQTPWSARDALEFGHSGRSRDSCGAANLGCRRLSGGARDALVPPPAQPHQHQENRPI